MSDHKKKEKQSDIIKEYEQRWKKPIVIILLVLFTPPLYFGIRHGPTVISAMTNYDASIAEGYTLSKRDDKEVFYDNTPKPGTDPVLSSTSELPDGPILIDFYLKHCPYCEAAHSSFEKKRQEFIKEHPEEKERVFYVDVTSPLGKELIHKHDVMGAASMLLLNGDQAEVLPSAENNAEKGIVPVNKNIDQAFETLETWLDQEK